MRTILYRAFAACILAALATPLLAQIGSGLGSGVDSARVGRVANAGNQPYTAEFKTTTVQTLANGTTITRESTEVQARDSQQRTIFSNSMPAPSSEKSTFTTFHVHDATNGTEISWNSRRKTAQVSKFPTGDQAHGCWRSDFGQSVSFGDRPQITGGSTGAPAANSVRPKPTLEDLGTENFQGVEAHGKRTTTITPIGVEGNDQPLVRTSETWTSNEFGIVVREIRETPSMGKRTKEMTSFTPGEPDPSLFQPPADYEVVNDEFHQVACPQ